jgi:hypothetical protein
MWLYHSVISHDRINMNPHINMLLAYYTSHNIIVLNGYQISHLVALHAIHDAKNLISSIVVTYDDVMDYINDS